jgi:hypothetical protein
MENSMMKKLVRIVCFLIIFGAWATAAHASDALINFDDPLCTPGPGCVQLEYTGTPGPVIFFPILVANPPGFYPDPAPPNNYNCASNIFVFSFPLADPTQFFGCGFLLGILENNTPYSLSITGANIPINLSLDSDLKCAPSDPTSICSGDKATVDPTPEPSTALLYTSGLLLIFLVGFSRKRLGASFRT